RAPELVRGDGRRERSLVMLEERIELLRRLVGDRDHLRAARALEGEELRDRRLARRTPRRPEEEEVRFPVGEGGRDGAAVLIQRNTRRRASDLRRTWQLRQTDGVGLRDERHLELAIATLDDERCGLVDRREHRPLAHLVRLDEGMAGRSDD